MAELPLKRQREETQIEEVDETKRHKSFSYNDILSLLDEADEEEEATQDLSSLMISLQHELSSDSIPCPITHNEQAASCNPKEVDEKERVMRHLLEASDDELGIPSMEAAVNNITTDYDDVGINNSVDGLWDLEDDAPNNYYTLLQSELFS